jgi:hypothetical protein
MLDAQVFVDLLLKFAVRMNLVRHDNFLSESLSLRISFTLTLPLWRERGNF